MNKTPATYFPSAERTGGALKQDHAAAVTNDAGDLGISGRRESMGTAQGGGPPNSPSPIAELARVAAEFQLRTIATVLCDGPCLFEGGVITPLMPILYINNQ